MARPRIVSDAQIDAAARSVFLEHGHGAPVAMVAAKLGVSHAALLQRAGSKDNLLMRALSLGTSFGPRSLDEPPPGTTTVATVVARLRAGPPQLARASALAALLLELHGLLATILPGLIVLRARGLPTGLAPDAEAPTVLLRRNLAQWLGRTGVMTHKRATVIAEALLGAIEARCFNAHVGGDAFITGEHPAFVEALVNGLVPELGRARRKTTTSKRQDS